MATLIENRIRWSGLLIAAGLIVVLVSLLWTHPLSFMAFLVIGCPLVVIGILLYLWGLAGRDGTPGKTVVSIVILSLLSLTVSGCGGNDPVIPARNSSSSALPAFDPSTSTARVFGKVVLDGKPDIPSVKIGRDEFCKMNGEKIFKQGALVSVDGGLRNVIIYIRAGYEQRAYKAPEQPAVLDQQLCVYVPHTLTLMKGQKLRILNSDPTFHNVHAEADGHTEFNIPQPKKGAEDIQTFSRAAMPIRIGCDFHTWMASYVGVFDHPFHTTSGETGKYELRLPPGKYEFVAWHEKYGEQVSSVEVAANESREMNFTYKIPQK